MSEHRAALEQIMRLCAESRTYTRRTQLINTVAMKALGMTASQRHQVHLEIMDRVGDQPMKAAYLQRQAKASAKMAAYMLGRHDIEIPPTVAPLAEGLHAAAQHEDAYGAFHLDGAA